jgi:hypothetical protein
MWNKIMNFTGGRQKWNMSVQALKLRYASFATIKDCFSLFSQWFIYFKSNKNLIIDSIILCENETLNKGKILEPKKLK